MSANVITKAPRQFFTSSMNFYNPLTDHELEWITANNDQYYQLGTDDKSLNDTVSVTIGSLNQSLIRSVWFLTPFDMTVTDISGIVMDDDFSSHANKHYIGIWVMAGFGSSGDTPGEETGSSTLTLKYITQDYVSSSAEDAAMGFYDSSPSLSLSAGDAVWGGHLQSRFDGSDAMTLTMTLCAEKN